MKKDPPPLTHSTPQKITLLMIPSNPGKVRRISFPLWLPKMLLLLLVALITGLSISTVHFSGSLMKTEQALIAEKITAAELKEENRLHVSEINQLKNQFLEIDERIARLNELENKVLHMVGLETSITALDDMPEEIHRETQRDYFDPQFLLVSRSSDTRTMTADYTDYEVDVEYLNELVETQTASMIQLVENVEAQLEYLDAQPNLWPTSGRISSPFGNRISPTNRRRTEFHQGIDIANSTGTSIVAAGSGIVTYAGYNGGYGRMVIVSHGYGYTSVYAHNNKILVEVGDRVEKGDLIALMGRTGRATGTHLHFEIRVHGEPVDPLTILQ
ncbi:MAG: M23 family metallopeptidase [Bacillota bacterium]|nr:M23 family metallopeptidase [Bacillota bacterium]MDW7677736.1 M23 family metallopeptidase [Bacillota bacterium]